MDLAELVQRFGVPVMITIIFVIDSRIRERRLSDAIGKQEAWVREKFLDTMEKVHEASGRVEQAIEAASVTAEASAKIAEKAAETMSAAIQACLNRQAK